MQKILIAVIAASLLSACAPRGPIVGESGCNVWNGTNGSLTGRSRAVEAECAAGFIDAYSVSHATREVKYGWVIDSISLECERDPSSTIQKAAEKAMKRFEE